MAALNPNLYTKSMLGDQAVSRRRSAPKYGFGSSTRQQAAKVFMSQEHAKLAPPAASTPGPSAYTLNPAVGTQVDGSKKSAPIWVFGSSDRFQGNTKPSAQNPGPGTYDMTPGVGPQTSSAKQTQPMFGFGTSTREHVSKVYVSEEHNKSLHGIESPGPVYELIRGVGKQLDSKKESCPAWVFGGAERITNDVRSAAGNPSPAAYTLNPAVGVQTASTKESSPIYGFGTSNRDHMMKLFISTEHVRIRVLPANDC